MQKQDLDSLQHTWMARAPIPMLAVGGDGRVRWANRALEAVVGLPASQLLGHTRATLPSPTHRVLFADAGLIHLNGPGAPERWLRCDVLAGDGDLRLHFYTDVTREVDLSEENRRLRSEVEDLRTTDALTGLANQRALARHLEMHVSRSRRYDNPLSLVHVAVAAPGPEGSADAAMLALGRHLRDRLRWVDEVARWDEDQFLVILPETGEVEAREVAANLLATAELPVLPAPYAEVGLEVRYGVASWQRGDDSRTLRRRAVAAAESTARAGHG
ncbi:MAG: hypothetical protein RLZ44_481 [Pseudomonadota bacterium]|jgi:GGDEF domain-containing protein